MSKIYETRLGKEFELLQRLERHPNVRGIINVFYKERMSGGGYKSVLENPTDSLYPNSFRVTYTMPMYVDKGVLKRDWSASFLFETPENILMDPESKLGVEIEGGGFPRGSVPFNNHVTHAWVCTGSAWGVANQGFGIWYFIISLGCLFNQEPFMMAEDGDNHLNGEAYRYWKYDRNMQPNNKIDWPFKLMDEPTFGKPEVKVVTFGKPLDKKQTFAFGEKKVDKPAATKSPFNFGPKKTD